MEHIDQIRRRARRLIDSDPYLAPYAGRIVGRLMRGERMRHRISPDDPGLQEATTRHTYFGLHRDGDGWVLREWAPFAEAVYLVGEHTGWETHESGAMQRREHGTWELRLPAQALTHGMLYRLRMHWPGGSGDRIPAYARRVVQDDATGIFNAQVWAPENPYPWRHPSPQSVDFPLIYEAHVGMAQDEERVGTYDEFREAILPRIADAGYNIIGQVEIGHGVFIHIVSEVVAVGCERLVQSAVEVDHDGYADESESDHMKLLQPVAAVGQQKGDHLRFSVIKAARPPGRVLPPGSVVEVQRPGPVEPAEPFHLVGHGVAVDQVHHQPDAVTVGRIDQGLEFFRGAAA